MRSYRSIAGTLVMSGALLAAAIPAAHAWEAGEVAGRLKGELGNQGFSIDWEAAEKDGSAIRLTGVKAGPPDNMAAIGDVTLDDVSEDADSYTIGNVAVPDYTAKDDKGSLTVHGVAFTGLDIPKQESDSDILHYRTAKLDNVAVTDKDEKEIFTLSGVSAEMQPPPDDGTLSFSGTADKFTIDLAAMTDKDVQRTRLEKLGYSQLSGNASLAGSWKPSDGHLKLSKYSLTVADAGTLDAMVDISGYTPAFIKQMREMGKQMKDKSNPDQQSAKGLAMLGLLQQLTFNGLSLKFEDDGFTDKALKLAAERQGTEPKQIANQIKGVIPLRLTEYLGPELTQKIADAVGAFLDDPQNIEISALPDSPVPFAILAGAAMAAPQTLVQTIGLDVKANQ